MSPQEPIFAFHLGSTNVPGGVNIALAAQCRAMSTAGVRSHVDYVVRTEPRAAVDTFARDRVDAFVSTRSAAAVAPVLRAVVSRYLLRRSEVIVHLHSGLPVVTPGMLAVRRAVPRGIPCVATFHGAQALLPRDEHRAMWDRHVRSIDAWDLVSVPSVCELEAQSRAGVPAERIECVENAVFTTCAAPPETAEHGAPSPRQLVFVGRLSAEKNVAPVLRAFAIVAASDPDTTLLCLGDGPEREALRSLAQSLGPQVEARLSMPGHSSDPAQVLATKPIFISLSKVESFGLVAFEAALCGAPLILSAIRPWTDYFRHEVDCLFVSPDDPTQAASAALRLLGDAGLRDRLVASARATAAGIASPEVVGRKWRAHYARLLQAGSRHRT